MRTVCKAFHHRGSEQCGSSTLFRTYCRKQGLHCIPLAHFVGNRFNILFYDAAGVFYLKDLMLKFIEEVHAKQANKLLQAVKDDLNNPVYITGCQVLGLIDKIVTGPLWRKLQKVESVLEMSRVYTSIKEKFELWSENPSTVIDGSATLFDEDDNDRLITESDKVFKCHIDSESCSMTHELMQILFTSFSATTQRLLLDHLPGGQFHSTVTDPVMTQETASVPTTNVTPERDFAVLDRLMREKPNANVIALESMIIFSHNKTSVWLAHLSYSEREKLLQTARTLAPTFRAKFKQRQQVIEDEREKALEEKIRENQRKYQREVQEKENLTKEIEKLGLWTSANEVQDGLDMLTTKAKKVNAVKVQINFRRKVLGQSHPDSSVFKFSKNHKQHSLMTLKENLLKLLPVPEELEASSEEEESDGCTPSLDQVQQCPQLLVGQRIRHRFAENDGELVWYQGQVIRMNSRTLEFYVLYDGEQDVCCFKLLEDIANGDLFIDP